jgi:clan AA aspartic protease
VIVGSVNASREAIVGLTVHGPRVREGIEAVVDTGFSGFLTLPPPLIAALGLPFRRRGRAVLADGSESLFDVYEAAVIWDGQPRRVFVDAADTEPLVGMALLYGHELTVHAVEGGGVFIRTLP